LARRIAAADAGGKKVHPGEAVRYVITNGDSRGERTRAMVEAIADDVQYDSEAYVDRLVCATETMLISSGCTREKLLGNTAR